MVRPGYVWKPAAERCLWGLCSVQIATHRELQCSTVPAEAQFECHIEITAPARYFRVRLLKEAIEEWGVYEVWLRGRKHSGI
jgi:hypothetical protein